MNREGEDFMIQFRCEHCGRKIDAPEIHTGKIKSCSAAVSFKQKDGQVRIKLMS